MAVESVDDGRDINKARGFLLTYSALVLALWYFGADLTQFKLMGNEIQLHQRTNSVWLVLAGLNAYFWFRYYQRMPPESLNFDKPMDGLYEESLEWLALKLDFKELKQKVADGFKFRGTPNQEFRISAYNAKVTRRPARKKAQGMSGGKASIFHFRLSEYRVTVELNAGHQYLSNEGWKGGNTITYHTRYLSAYQTWPLKAFSIVRGAFITPWFTDYIAPLLLGAISTGFALWKWCDMNFFTTTLPHLAQSCAGVTH